ncbi:MULTISPECIES: S4 domain-containing protein [unclassified Luteibacter]|uniref:RNA-binding S4 domain-containing protein n=1 Tax=unclassified Luteibacter TaxID=2620188 RepID=UPI0008B7907E|nr:MULTISPECIES: S4 domain-containing protein [unclassified Luteibacter]MDR6934994.1 ribosome-associated heat shock protein Hsp15 [Luteibacter sp. 3190]SEW00584.1 heat shock protein Hsp15 [Luteibacter sp. 329MFSha]
MTDTSTTSGVRADVWLWAARFFKTRSLAKQAIDGGKVELNDATCKPAKAVQVGDTLRITRGEERIVCTVTGLSQKRGPAPEARKLYAETEASVAERERQREDRRLTGGALLRPDARPDKRDRRLIQDLKKTL